MMTHDSSLATPLTTPSPHSAAEPLSAASQRAGLGQLAQHLNALRHWMDSDLQALESDLGDIDGFTNATGSSRHVAQRAAEHLLGQPGKRIRPMCVLLGARIADYTVDQTIRDLAVACELVHAATLLHDDVIDEGTERRGAPAARVVFGNSASILAGDYLLVEALDRVQRAAQECTGGSELMSSLLKTISEMVAAEAEQLERRGRFAPQREAYMRIIEGKTASLFCWALQAGAIAAKLPRQQITALGSAGRSLGIAFQLIDDLMDLEGDATTIGKDLFADLEQGKLTWPLIIASERDPSLQSDVSELYTQAQAGRLDEEEALRLVDRVRKTGALDTTRSLARTQQEHAYQQLDLLPNSQALRALRTVIAAAVERSR